MFFVVCLSLAARLSAQTLTVNTDQLDYSINLSPTLSFLEDKPHKLSWKEIDSGIYDADFKNNTAKFFAGENRRSGYWFRLQLQLDAQDSKDETTAVLFFHSMAASLYQLKIRTTENNVVNTPFITGNLQPFDSRDIDSLHFAFTINLAKGHPTEILGYVDNSANGVPARLPIFLISEKSFSQLNNTTNFFLVAFYAVMAALFLYNASLFVILKHRVYFSYISFLLFAVMTCAGQDGSIARWVFPDAADFNVRLQMMNGILAPIAYTSFVFHALSSSVRHRAMQRLYHLMQMVGDVIF